MALLRNERFGKRHVMGEYDGAANEVAFVQPVLAWDPFRETGAPAQDWNREEDNLHQEVGGAPESVYQRAMRAVDEAEAPYAKERTR